MRDLWAAPTREHDCEVNGCGRPAPYGRFCSDCQEQSAALAEWEQRQRVKRARRAVWMWSVLNWIKKNSPIALMVVAGIAVFCVGWKLFDWFLDWLR